MKRLLIKKTTRPIGIICSVIFLLVLIFGVGAATQAKADSNLPAGQHLITVHDGNQTRGILTAAATLRDAFKTAGINIDPNDMVEPSLDDPLVATNYEVNIYRARPVTIVDGAIREKVMSPYQTATQIAKQAGVTLHDEDTTTMTANTDMVSEGAGVQLTINRATPFTLVLYGTKIQAYTQAKIVADMLKQKQITLGKDDTLSTSLATSIQAGMTIELWRNGKQTATEQQDVPFDVKQVQDVDQPVGYKQVQTPGVVGKKTVTYEIEMKNGQQVSRTEIQSVVTQQPVQEVDIVGTKISLPPGSHTDWMAAAGIAASDYGFVDYIMSHESGWRPNAVSSNGYYGLGQTNLKAISTACPNWQSDPICQLGYFSGYAVSRYGSWQGAYNHWAANRSW